MIGTLSFYPDIVSIDLIKGRFLSHMDEVYKQNVCVLTTSLAQRLFPYHDPLEQTIKIAGVYYRVVGLVRKSIHPMKGHNLESLKEKRWKITCICLWQPAKLALVKPSLNERETR